jgi:hypothetical protein
MATYYEISKSVRITNAEPIDGDRYLAKDIAARQKLLVAGTSVVRAHVGLQVFVADARTTQESDDGVPAYSKLYLLKAISPDDIWEEIPTGEVGVSKFIDLLDTPDSWPGSDGTNYIVEIDYSGGAGNEKLKFTATKTAYNQNFGDTSSMPADSTADGGANSAGISPDLARIDHSHDGKYYTKSEINTKLDAVNAGIKYIWDTKDSIDGTFSDEEQGLLKDSTVGTTSEIVCNSGAWVDMGVYKYDGTNACWTLLYVMGGGTADTTAEKVKMHSTGGNEFTVTKDLGGYKSGNVVSIDNDVYSVLKKLLVSPVDPTLNPPAVISITEDIPTSGLVEVGTSLNGGTSNRGFSATLDKGNINGWDSSGGAISVDQVGNLKTGVLSMSGGFQGTIGDLSGDATYGANVATASYDTEAGSTPVYDSNGTEYTAFARTISKSLSISVTGGYNVVAGMFSDAEKANITANATVSGIKPTNTFMMSTSSVTKTGYNLEKDKKWVIMLVQGTYSKDDVVNDDASLRKLEIVNSGGDVFTNHSTTSVSTIQLRNDANQSITYTYIAREMGSLTNPDGAGIVKVKR